MSTNPKELNADHVQVSHTPYHLSLEERLALEDPDSPTAKLLTRHLDALRLLKKHSGGPDV